MATRSETNQEKEFLSPVPEGEEWLLCVVKCNNSSSGEKFSSTPATKKKKLYRGQESQHSEVK